MKHFIYLSLLFYQPGFTQPLFSSSCEVAAEVVVLLKSPGFFMSDDCRTAYILPPTKGSVTVNGATVGNLDRCKEVSALNDKSDEAVVNDLYRQRQKALSEY